MKPVRPVTADAKLNVTAEVDNRGHLILKVDGQEIDVGQVRGRDGLSGSAGLAAGSSTVTGAMAAVAPTVGTVNVADGGGAEIIVVKKVKRPVYLLK